MGIPVQRGNRKGRSFFAPASLGWEISGGLRPDPMPPVLLTDAAVLLLRDQLVDKLVQIVSELILHSLILQMAAQGVIPPLIQPQGDLSAFHSTSPSFSKTVCPSGLGAFSGVFSTLGRAGRLGLAGGGALRSRNSRTASGTIRSYSSVSASFTRKYNQVTDFGKFVDPLADKLLVASALILFVEQKAMAGWMVCVILARELIITSLRVVAANKGVVMAATWTGKVKTCVQIGGIIVIYLYYIITGALANGVAFADGDGVTAVMVMPHTDGMPLLLTIVGWVVTLVTIYSGYDYLKKNWDLIKDGAVKAK